MAATGLAAARSGDTFCAPGYTSIKCTVCVEGYGQTGDKCIDCGPETPWNWALMLTIPAWTIFQMVGPVTSVMIFQLL